ncbi:MAG: hypothetical protein JRH20_22640 [Deltaproteobacteria bacterium]|nr:hypothetical protein [Deltaproteobacteria bacterium]
MVFRVAVDSRCQDLTTVEIYLLKENGPFWCYVGGPEPINVGLEQASEVSAAAFALHDKVRVLLLGYSAAGDCLCMHDGIYPAGAAAYPVDLSYAPSQCTAPLHSTCR